jgi:hypothetical protein
MPFPKSVREEALLKSRRCCCVCHEFAGRYVNVHHIIPEAEGGPSTLENAIVLCLRCHGEAGHYNPRHPIGNKYSPSELRRHRDEWWQYCTKNIIAPIPKGPVSVSPGRVDLRAGKWKSRSTIKVYNKTNEVYYQIWVKLTLDPPETLPENIQIEPRERKDELSAKVDSVVVSNDVLRINGTDEAGNKVILLRLASLDPGEVRTFVAENNSLSSQATPVRAYAHVDICEFSQEPAPILIQGEGAAAIRLTLPENIRPKGGGLLLKRSSKGRGRYKIT